jgi:hypothetical protein
LELTNLEDQFWQHSLILSGIIEDDPFEKALDLDDDKVFTKVLESFPVPRLTVNLLFIPLAEREEFWVVDESETEKVNRKV